MTEKNEYNQEIVELNDANYIFLLYMIYILKKIEKNKEFLSFAQLKSKIKEYAKKDLSLEKIVKLSINDVAFEKLYNDVY